MEYSRIRQIFGHLDDGIPGLAKPIERLVYHFWSPEEKDIELLKRERLLEKGWKKARPKHGFYVYTNVNWPRATSIAKS